MDTIFSLSSLLVMPLWAAMILLPRWRWTARIVESHWIAAPAAALYAVLVLPVIGEVWPVVTSPTLATVAALLGSPAGATIGWIHYLAFDLFVGRWAYLDARERGISPWVMAPVLFLTLMLGPVGFLAYLGVRSAYRARTAEAVDAVRGAAGAALAVNRPLALLAIVMLPLALLTLVGIALDPREIVGAPAWLKPFKFAASISIYSFTLLWMLGKVEGRPRWVRWVAGATTLAFVVEWGVIAVQAYRGTISHFNTATPLDGLLFSTMGIFVIVIWAMNLVAAGLLLRQRLESPSLAWSLRLGLLVAAIGGAMGAAMLPPTPEQQAAMQRGERPMVVGAHTVGAPDGGPGLPVTGWSTTAGDVRAPHFFGLHGLQVIPLLGILLGRSRRLREGQRVALVGIGSLAYLGFVGILFWQAMRGEPVVAPGPETVRALASLALVTLTATVGVLLPRGLLRLPGRAVASRAG